MIDYEKLKQAHDIIIKHKIHVTIRHGVGLDYEKNTFQYFHLYLWDVSSACDKFDNIDDLLKELTGLTKPEPKFKVGDTVWFNDYDSPSSFEVREIVLNDDYQYLYEEPEYGLCPTRCAIPECDLYATKDKLIESRIKYWTSLRTVQDVPIDEYCDVSGAKLGKREECDHESDGNNYLNSTNGIDHCAHSSLVHLKCIKCGERYDYETCSHESDGRLKIKPGYTQYLYECKKCGEFYK